MVRLNIFAAVLGAASVQALPNGMEARSAAHPDGCGAIAPVGFEAVTAAFGSFEAAERSAGNESALAERQTTTITIDTYFHVVARSTALSGGYVPASQLTNQLAIMNTHYGKESYLSSHAEIMN